MTNKAIVLYLSAISLLLLAAMGWYFYSIQYSRTQGKISRPTTLPVQTYPNPATLSFSGRRAYADVQTQVAFGSRVPETEGHAKIVEWMREELLKAGWQVEIQQSKVMGHPIQNLVAKRNEEPAQIIVGAHYDTRMFADNDPDAANHSMPMPGANDGASGVAVLLELARTLPKDAPSVWLVFFDAEDNYGFTGWDGELGSREFVKNNHIQARAVIVVDMIGDADLNIYKEQNSNPDLSDQIWNTAKSLGYENKFISDFKYAMQDDHTPFLQAGIPAVDLIDFDYPYWHTVQDTPDKVSAASLEIVGKTLWTWITQQKAQP